MRILAAIPHYYSARGSNSPDRSWHGSVGQGADSRVAALSSCVAALHRHYGPAQHIIDHARRIAIPANQRTTGRIDVVVCTTGEDHLLGRLALPPGSITRHPTRGILTRAASS
jgi:hypothetical protein